MALLGEKKDVESNGEQSVEDVPAEYTDEGAVRKSDFTAGNSTYAKLQRFAGRFGIEQRGIERVPRDEQTETHMSKIGTLVSLLKKKSSLLHLEQRRDRL